MSSHLERLRHHVTGAIERGEAVAIVEQRKLETFKCATGSGWGLLVNDRMDCDVPYAPDEAGALRNAQAAYPGQLILTTADADHYSNKE